MQNSLEVSRAHLFKVRLDKWDAASFGKARFDESPMTRL